MQLATLLVIALGLACSAAKPRRGDVEQGPCRRDVDCPAGQQCVGESQGHLRSATGEIVGDSIQYRCAAIPPDAPL